MSGTRSKYYLLLSVLGALVVALVVLAIAPSAQATIAPVPPSIDKECTPNPVQLGQQLTCTIEVVPAPFTTLDVVVSDTFPVGLTVTEAAFQFVTNGVAREALPCAVTGNSVRCPSEGQIIISNLEVANRSIRVTIDATAGECGTFENIARAEGRFLPQEIPFSVEAKEEITVEGCEVPPAPEPGQQQPNQQQGSPAPITQDFEQDSEAGEVDQSFDIS